MSTAGLMVLLALLQEPGSLLDLPSLGQDGAAFEATSYDRTGGNDDGFSTDHTVRYVDPVIGHVLLDAEGPGVLTRICIPFWGAGMASQAPWDDYRLRFHFDDEPSPRIDLAMRDIFRRVHPAFSGPTVM